ncbi:hypothetical protein M7I_7500 [Glarea lozoyensis 74030]|uniref:BTB domain-containing protein n=1 Tax=Glarea lozoyensis (strain ATCC 74030 / MF5533) TaxID=1104152 RepID=H0EXG5_GLAL7|nr:hypothetical protein M7I_7500 [Glarea lozoyensis 74030]
MDVHTLITGSSEKITLAVGEKAKPISCHKALLGFFSKFFESALYGSFAEASQTEMRLPEDDPELMSEFVAWLYSGQSPSQIDLEEEEYCEQEPEPAADCILVREDIEREMRMLSLWILADKLGSPRLANNTMRYYEEQPFCTHNRGKYIEKIESKPSAKDWLKQKHPPEVADEPWTEITTKK